MLAFSTSVLCLHSSKISTTWENSTNISSICRFCNSNCCSDIRIDVISGLNYQMYLNGQALTGFFSSSGCEVPAERSAPGKRKKGWKVSLRLRRSYTFDFLGLFKPSQRQIILSTFFGLLTKFNPQLHLNQLCIWGASPPRSHFSLWEEVVQGEILFTWYSYVFCIDLYL